MTYCLEGSCSIQLSYRTNKKICRFHRGGKDTDSRLIIKEDHRFFYHDTKSYCITWSIQYPFSIIIYLAFMDVKIEPGWKELLKDEFAKPYFQQIALHL